MQEEELSSNGDSDHTDSERSVASLDSRKHSIILPYSSISSKTVLLGYAESASMAARLAVGKPEDASSSVPDSAISIGRSSIITGTKAGVTLFSEVS